MDVESFAIVGVVVGDILDNPIDCLSFGLPTVGSRYFEVAGCNRAFASLLFE